MPNMGALRGMTNIPSFGTNESRKNVSTATSTNVRQASFSSPVDYSKSGTVRASSTSLPKKEVPTQESTRGYSEGMTQKAIELTNVIRDYNSPIGRLGTGNTGAGERLLRHSEQFLSECKKAKMNPSDSDTEKLSDAINKGMKYAPSATKESLVKMLSDMNPNNTDLKEIIESGDYASLDRNKWGQIKNGISFKTFEPNVNGSSQADIQRGQPQSLKERIQTSWQTQNKAQQQINKELDEMGGVTLESNNNLKKARSEYRKAYAELLNDSCTPSVAKQVLKAYDEMITAYDKKNLYEHGLKERGLFDPDFTVDYENKARRLLELEKKIAPKLNATLGLNETF